jgi:hypothetical protein
MKALLIVVSVLVIFGCDRLIDERSNYRKLVSIKYSLSEYYNYRGKLPDTLEQLEVEGYWAKGTLDALKPTQQGEWVYNPGNKNSDVKSGGIIIVHLEPRQKSGYLVLFNDFTIGRVGEMKIR